MDTREKIVEFVKSHGPVIPIHIAKELNCNSVIASAHLSEMVSSKLLKISHVKLGSSPLYYLSGQEDQLQQYAGNLHEKEKRSYDLLKEQKVMRDSTQDPLVRVTLREIKDFAIPIQVTYDTTSELFWKWYLISNEEATEKIKVLLGKKEEKPAEAPLPIPPVKKNEPEKQLVKMEEKKIQVPDVKQKKEILEKKPIERPIERKKDIQEKLPAKIEEKPTKPKKEEKKVVQETLKESKLKKEERKKGKSFEEDVALLFSQNNIEIIEKTIIKKDADIDLVIRVPSSVGSLLYFCKARSKQKINEGDLSSAYIQSQSKKMPILYLTTGELTKKAKELLEKEFKSMTLKQM